MEAGGDAGRALSVAAAGNGSPRTGHSAGFLPPFVRMAKQILQTTRAERAVRGGRRIALEFRDGERGEQVPAILLLPTANGTAPASLLLHGYSSRKERLSDTIGHALLGRGIASLAIDLPLHGEREPMQAQSMRNPLELIRRWRLALSEASLALRYLGARSEVDRDRLSILGYSLGSFLGVVVAEREPAVRAVVLAAGGDLPAGTPLAALARGVADPIRAVRKLAGRPLLMVNGRNDRTIGPDQAERLYAAASEPKELRWYPSGHVLPPQAADDVAEWLAERLRLESRRRSG